MSEKKTGTGWLAIGDDGAWSLVAYSEAHNIDSPKCGVADEAIGGTEGSSIFALHKVTFQLPDPPKVQGEDVAVTVGKAEKR